MEYTQTQNGNAVVLAIKGRINAGNAETLKSLVKSVLDNNDKNIIFDFSEVDFIDSSGLGSLVGCLRSVKRSGGDIKISGLIDKVRVVFELIRLHHLFDIYDTTEKAVKAYD